MVEVVASTHVLLVEDDEELAQLVERYLRANGMVVLTVSNGASGLASLRNFSPDLVLLDLGLPDIDGLEICKRIRERWSMPIILLTARDGEFDRVVGLESGADDFVVKPFSPAELVARIRAQVRRARGAVGPRLQVIRVANLEVDNASREARLGGKQLVLTSYEFDLLYALAANAGRPLTREQLMEIAGGASDQAFDRSIDVHVSRIRTKLGDGPKEPKWIKTVRGVGYLMAMRIDENQSE